MEFRRVLFRSCGSGPLVCTLACFHSFPQSAIANRAYTVAAILYFIRTMTITIDEGLRAYIDPLTEDEFAALERSLLSEGCRDALEIGRASGRERVCQSV